MRAQDRVFAIVAPGRIVPNQRIERFVGKDLVERAHPVRPFGMTGPGIVVHKAGMRQQKRCHDLSFPNAFPLGRS